MLRMRSLSVVSLALAGCVSDPPRAVEDTPREERPYAPPSDLAVNDLALSRDPAVTALGPESRASLERSTVPMLVLPAPYADGSLVMVGPTWTALSYQGDGITITLHATGHWHDMLDEGELLDIPSPTARVRQQPAWETVNELIRSLAWNERGPDGEEVAYALEIECARPEEDTRCTESTFLATVAHQLVDAHVTGTPTIEPQQPGDPLQGDPTVGGAR